jgi:peroxiredoxin
MRSVRTVAALLGLSICALFAEQTVPRPSPEFVINYPGGKQALLSQYKGKVVLLAFIFTTCPHCQVTCQLVSKLNTELGAKGFQPLAVAVNPMALMLVNDFVRDFHTNFPVGASETAPALSFMQISGADRWVVPQVVLIDRKGVIRAQTPPQGDEKMQEENHLRQQIENLLHEGAPTSKRAATPKKRQT